MKRFFPVVVVLVVIAAAFFVLSSFPAAANGAVVPNQVGTNATAIPSNVDVSSLGTPRILAWNPNTALLSWIGKDGKTASVGKADTAKAILTTCGTNPAGDTLIVYQGAENVGDAQPYLLPFGGGKTQPLGANIGLACAIPGGIQYSPDGNRLGVLKFTPQTLNNPYAIGTLRILKMPEGTEQGTIDNVVGFDLQNDGAVAIQLFTNQKNQVKSADVVFWDGNKTRKIDENVLTLNQDEKSDCEFITARALRVNDKVYTLWGEKCKKGGVTTWRIRRADFNGGNGVEVTNGPTGLKGAASYINSAASNTMFALPNGNILFTVPNGTKSNIVDLARLDTASGSVSTVLTNVTVNTYPPADDQNQFLRSPKGDKLALVTRNGDGNEQLFIYDLSTPDAAPKPVAGGKQDQITGVAWQADGQKLFYAIVGDIQALYSYTLAGENNLITRGTFSNIAVSPDGAWIGAAEEVKPGPNQIRHNFVVISVGDEQKTTLIEGAKGDKSLSALVVR